jgi:hypothetical protein
VDGRPSGVLRRKIVSQCREQARRVYYSAVLEAKKEILDRMSGHRELMEILGIRCAISGAPLSAPKQYDAERDTEALVKVVMAAHRVHELPDDVGLL